MYSSARGGDGLAIGIGFSLFHGWSPTTCRWKPVFGLQDLVSRGKYC